MTVQRLDRGPCPPPGSPPPPPELQKDPLEQWIAAVVHGRGQGQGVAWLGAYAVLHVLQSIQELDAAFRPTTPSEDEEVAGSDPGVPPQTAP